MSIFSENGIDIKNIDPDRIMVLGIDNGDGEYVATMVEKTKDKIVCSLLMPKSSGEPTECSIALYNANGGFWEIGSGIAALKNNFNTKVYTNYKKLPSTGQAFYLNQSNALSYNAIMANAFSKLIYNIIIYNDKIKAFSTKIQGAFDVFIFVGHPSSKKWSQESIEYNKILESQINSMKNALVKRDPGLSFVKRMNFHVISISEARGAMAYEHKVANRQINKEEIILIIDGGSSTFDAVIIKGSKFLAEYSRQIGAGMIDKNLFDILLFGENTAKNTSWDDRQRKRKELEQDGTILSEGLELYEIREQKEKYYGKSGTAQNREAIIALNDKSLFIHDCINAAIEQLPVTVEASYGQNEKDDFHCHERYEYESFKAGIQDFFAGVKAKCTDLKIDRIILTGGATIMPFVNSIVKTTFETENKDIKLDNDFSAVRKYSVAQGVAYIGYLELFKEKVAETLLVDAVNTIDKNELTSLIVEKNAENIYNVIDYTFCTWKDTTETIAALYSKCYPCNFNGYTQSAVESYIKNTCLNKINALLKATAKEILPADNSFDYDIENISIEIKNLVLLFENLHVYFKSNNIFSGLSTWWNGNATTHTRTCMYTNWSKNKDNVMSQIKADINDQMKEKLSYLIKTLCGSIKDELEKYMQELYPYLITEDTL